MDEKNEDLVEKVDYIYKRSMTNLIKLKEENKALKEENQKLREENEKLKKIIKMLEDKINQIIEKLDILEDEKWI